MMVGMTKKKIAVTVDADVLRAAKRAVSRGDATSLSALVTESLRQRTTDDELKRMLEETLRATGGPMTESERREVDRVLYGPSRRRKRRRRAA
jgi:hypothetical protein